MSQPAGDERADADLLAAHLAGDPDAFGTLVGRHRDRLWALALRTTGHPEDAADGLQDGLVAAYRRAATFRGDAAVTTWLHRVVVNACLDRIRAARVRRSEPLPTDLAELHGLGVPHPPAAPADDPGVRGAPPETRRLVLAALRALPVEQRVALVLVDMEGYPVAEAAAVLGCPVGTVKSRCSRGRARLAVLLGVLDPHRERAAAEPRRSPVKPGVGPERGSPAPVAPGWPEIMPPTAIADRAPKEVAP